MMAISDLRKVYFMTHIYFAFRSIFVTAEHIFNLLQRTFVASVKIQ